MGRLDGDLDDRDAPELNADRARSTVFYHKARHLVAIWDMPVRMLCTRCALLIALITAVSARAEVSTPVGVWVDANQRIQVKIAPCGDRLCGKIVWFRWPNDSEGLPLVDLKNPDPALHSRPLLGLRVLDGLRRSSKSKWGDGRIYNPDDGIDYHAEMSIAEDGTLRVRAYHLLPIFGKTFVWTRAR